MPDSEPKKASDHFFFLLIYKKASDHRYLKDQFEKIGHWQY